MALPREPWQICHAVFCFSTTTINLSQAWQSLTVHRIVSQWIFCVAGAIDMHKQKSSNRQNVVLLVRTETWNNKKEAAFTLWCQKVLGATKRTKITSSSLRSSVCVFLTLSPSAADLSEAGALAQTIEALLFDQLHDLWLDFLPKLPGETSEDHTNAVWSTPLYWQFTQRKTQKHNS